MAYKRATNIKKSVIQWLTDKIQEDGVYVVGPGASMLTIYNAYPVEPVTFKQPSMSVDFGRIAPRREYDLGYDATYPYDFVLDVFGRDSTEDEYIASVVLEAMHQELIEYRDYDLSADGACNTGWIFVRDEQYNEVRVETPGNESEYRSQVLFTGEYNAKYYK